MLGSVSFPLRSPRAEHDMWDRTDVLPRLRAGRTGEPAAWAGWRGVPRTAMEDCPGDTLNCDSFERAVPSP